jgi:hypothetical protein
MNILERLVFASLNTYDENVIEVKMFENAHHIPEIRIKTRLVNGTEYISIFSLEKALEALENDGNIRDFVDTLYASRLANQHGYEIEPGLVHSAVSDIIERSIWEAFGCRPIR